MTARARDRSEDDRAEVGVSCDCPAHALVPVLSVVLPVHDEATVCPERSMRWRLGVHVARSSSCSMAAAAKTARPSRRAGRPRAGRAPGPCRPDGRRCPRLAGGRAALLACRHHAARRGSPGGAGHRRRCPLGPIRRVHPRKASAASPGRGRDERASLGNGIATGDQAIFVRRAVYRAAGVFSPIPPKEDVDLGRRWRALGAPAGLHEPARTSGRRRDALGLVAQRQSLDPGVALWKPAARGRRGGRAGPGPRRGGGQDPAHSEPGRRRHSAASRGAR